MIYNFIVNSNPSPRKNYKFGSLIEAIYIDGTKENQNFTVLRHEDKVKELQIQVFDQTKTPNPYPDAININFNIYAFNDKTISILNYFDLDFRTIPVKITNNSHLKYKVVFFKKMSSELFDKELTDLTKDVNSEMAKKIFSISIPYNSPYLLASIAKKSKGVYRRPNYPNALVCTEEVMKQFKKNKITGIEFYPIEIEDEEQYR
jgi:hypothetical protein